MKGEEGLRGSRSEREDCGRFPKRPWKKRMKGTACRRPIGGGGEREKWSRFVGNSFLLFEPVFKASASVPRADCPCVRAHASKPSLSSAPLFLRERTVSLESGPIIDPEKVRRDLSTIYRMSLRFRQGNGSLGAAKGIEVNECERKKKRERSASLILFCLCAAQVSRLPVDRLQRRRNQRPGYPLRISLGSCSRATFSRHEFASFEVALPRLLRLSTLALHSHT